MAQDLDTKQKSVAGNPSCIGYNPPDKPAWEMAGRVERDQSQAEVAEEATGTEL